MVVLYVMLLFFLYNFVLYKKKILKKTQWLMKKLMI
jgi:hypothetical protein